MPNGIFIEAVAEQVWNSKYRLLLNKPLASPAEPDLHATWSRVALALSATELHHRDEWMHRYQSALAHFRFLPGGRILANAGSDRRSTLFNCFVMGTIRDSIDSIFSALGESMLTLQEGGGIGIDFSTLRPAGMLARESGNTASGPLSFMHVWEASCATLMAGNSRHGAMMATLRCDHPDIEAFVDAKRDPDASGTRHPSPASSALRHFNLSVLVSDAFMQAVDEDAAWPLVFPLADRPVPADGMICERVWPGSKMPQPCLVSKTISARELWDRIMRAAFDCGDPGVLFIDRVQRANNLWYCETISATNPCGEVPLPAYGACNLGSINLTQFVQEPFGKHAKMDLSGIAGTAAVATRMLDNVYDISHFPLKAQARAAHAARRIGLGITGLADAFAMLGLRYGSDSSIELAETLMRTICHAAYRTSVEMAGERGVFSDYRETEYLGGDFINDLPHDIIDSIRQHGIHNSHLTAIAPAGSISLLANNVSSGIEPIYALQGKRKLRGANSHIRSVPVHDYAWALFRRMAGMQAPLPEHFIEAHAVEPLDQLRLQARLQAHVDQAISKTINIPQNASFERYREIFREAYRLGLKGCTMFRSCDGRESVLGTH